MTIHMFLRQWRKKSELRHQELRKRMDKVEQALEKLTDKNFQYTVNIGHLHAHQPVLEQLTFRLDQLDVNTVSGALNLGNNFGVRVVQEGKKQNETKNHDKDTQAASDGFNMKQTTNGYNFTFKRSSP